MRRSGGTREIDETDRVLCELLSANPRTSNRALAVAAGVTDETVAARLRRLRDQGVLATTVIVDWEAAGYTTQAMVRVAVGGRSFRDVTESLSRLPITSAISDTSGACDGVVNVFAQSLHELHHFVTTHLGTRPGVRDTTVEVVVDDLKVARNVLTLPIPEWDPTELPSPRLPLDELDLSLIRELTSDGHESNSEVARRLGVSDVTVRRRIQRLESHGILRIVAAVDPVATGDVTAVAFAFCRHTTDDDTLRAALADEPAVIAAYTSIGTATCILLLGAKSDAELQEFSSIRLWALPGIQSVELAPVNDVLFHRSHLGRIHTG
jgi:DNA-binding Lrp family transcriptional regulator